MTDQEMWSLIIGVFLPVVIAFFEQPKWNDSQRAIAAVVICIVVGGIQTYLQGQFNVGALSHSILLILVAALTTYKAFWQKTQLVPYLEKLTSPSSTTTE